MTKLLNIIEELDKIEPLTDTHLFVESKANHAIVSALNVLKLIRENYSPEEAEDLTRRFINSIKGNDPRKFQRKIRQIREAARNG